MDTCQTYESHALNQMISCERSPHLLLFIGVTWVVTMMTIAVMSACVERPRAPVSFAIYDVRPAQVAPGGGISLIGVGFGLQGLEDQVTLSGEALDVLYWSAERIDLRLPTTITPGAKWLIVSAGRRVSSGIAFEVLETHERAGGDPRADQTTHDATSAEMNLNDQSSLGITSDLSVDFNLPDLLTLPSDLSVNSP